MALWERSSLPPLRRSSRVPETIGKTWGTRGTEGKRGNTLEKKGKQWGRYQTYSIIYCYLQCHRTWLAGISHKKNGGFGLARLESRAGNQHRKLMDVDGMSTTNDSIGVQCDLIGCWFDSDLTNLKNRRLLDLIKKNLHPTKTWVLTCVRWGTHPVNGGYRNWNSRHHSSSRRNGLLGFLGFGSNSPRNF